MKNKPLQRHAFGTDAKWRLVVLLYRTDAQSVRTTGSQGKTPGGQNLSIGIESSYPIGGKICDTPQRKVGRRYVINLNWRVIIFEGDRPVIPELYKK